MAYTVERHRYQQTPWTPVAVKLVGDWKRSLTARARIFLASGAVSKQEVRYLAELWLNLHTAETFFRLAEGLPAPGPVPEWVSAHGLGTN